MKRIKMFFIGLTMFLIPFLGFSGVLKVPSDYPTIQEAIWASVDGDIILVADGIYTRWGNINIKLNEKKIVIRSANGPKNCVIDGTNDLYAFGFKGAANDSASYIPKCNTTIEGFTIQNCEYGFYISGENISPTIKNNIIKNCRCGIFIKHYAKNVNIIGNEIRNNEISNIVTYSNIKYDQYKRPYQGINSYQPDGGAICIVKNSSAKIQNNLIMNNKGSHAGGIYCDEVSTAEILNNDILNNSAYAGGGITVNNPSVVVMNNIITNSTQFSNGNKLQRWNYNEMFMQITYEGAKRTGVTYYYGFKNNGETGEVKITGKVNQTFTIQSGEYYWLETTSFVNEYGDGGGIDFDVQMGTEELKGLHVKMGDVSFGGFGGCYYLKNTTLKSFGTNNQSTSGLGILAIADKPFTGIAYNNIYENQGGNFILKQEPDTANTETIDLPDSNGNISKDPKLSNINYSLLTASPCIDAGNPDAKYNDASLPPGLGTVRNDMGAFGGLMNPEISFTVVPTGIDPNKLNESVKVYPNPFTNELFIEIEGNTNKIDFEVLNSVGQVIYNGVLIEKTVVPTTSFTPGMYFIKLKSGEKFEIMKIVKNSQ